MTTPVVLSFPSGCPPKAAKSLIDMPGVVRVETGQVDAAGNPTRVVVHFTDEKLAAEFAAIAVATIPGVKQAL